MKGSKNRLRAVLVAVFILGLASMIYVLASTLTAGGYSLGAALQRSQSYGGVGTEAALAGGVPNDLEAIAVHAVLGSLDTMSTDRGLTLQLASFSPTGFIDETSGAASTAFDLIVPHLPEVAAGLSDTMSRASGNTAFGANGTSGLSLGGSPQGGGSDNVVSDATTTSVPEPSGLILLGTGLVSVASAPMLSRRWRSRRAGK